MSSTAPSSLLDVEAATAGSRTPRQSRNSADEEDRFTTTDAESQLYQDARSYAGSSVPSLALPAHTPTGGPSSTMIPASTGAAAAMSTSASTATMRPITEQQNTHSGSSQSQQNSLPTPTSTMRGPSAAVPAIDPPTARAYSETTTTSHDQQHASDTASHVPGAIKASLFEETAGLVNRQAGTQAFLPQPAREENTLPSTAEHAATEHTLTDPNHEVLAPASNMQSGAQLAPAGSSGSDTASDSPERLDGDSKDKTTNSADDGHTTMHNSRAASTKAADDQRAAQSSSSASSLDANEKNTKEKRSGLFSSKKGKKHADGRADKKGKGGKSETGKDVDAKVRTEDDPELAHFTPEQKRIILAQVEMGNANKSATYADIYKFSTKFELLLDAIGLLAAIASGIVQPLMTVVFGNLTTAFVEFGTAVAYGQDTTGARGRLFHEVNKDALFLLYIGIGMFCTTYIYMASWIYTGETTTRRIREAYLRSVLRQNIGFFDSLGAGEVTTRITSDMHLIQEGISEKIPITAQFIATFFAGFIVAFIKNWRLTLVLSCIVPAIGVTGAAMATFQAKYRTKMLALIAEGGTLAEETISSIRTAQAFGTQKKLAALYDIPNAKALGFGKATALLTAVGLCLFFFIIYASYALAFWWGTTLILRGDAVAGQIITCFFAVLIGAFSLSQIAPNMQAVGYAIGAANKVLFTIWRVPPIDSASPAGEKPDKVEGTIALHNVEFYYPSRPSVKVLEDFSVTFPKGKITALVGASGSGKSSVIGLIQRFYNVLGGSITLDGREITTLNIKWLRSRIGLVSQEPTLFASTIWENVAYGLINTPHEHASEDVKRKMVIEACKLANADDFIVNLPEGYDTSIGERGMLLSGGQKQRIAIARAVVSNPPILLLDEATSALDTTSEVLVQKALDQASAGRTTITIAHRLSTIKDADQIIVMTKGRIVEQGTHESLLERTDGAYAALVRAQALREQEEEDTAPDEVNEREAEEMIDKEAKEIGQLKRTGTGRSEASEILEQKRLEQEANAKKDSHGVIYLLTRLIKEIWETKWYYFVGTIASVVIGMVYPVFSIVFGALLGVFSSLDRQVLRSGGDKYAGYMFAVACVSAFAIFIQTYCFGYTSEYLSRTLRVRLFSATLRSDIAFFDEDKNSTGALTSNISEQPQKVNAACGVTLGVIIQSIVTLIGGCIIGLCYSWKVSLVGIACIPITLSAGIVRLRVVNLKDQKVRGAHEKSAQTACEAAAAIRTVASLTREEDASEAYSRSLEEPMRITNRIALLSNVFFSLSQALTFPTIALIFWFGSHQMVDHGLATRDFFISLTSIIFGSIQAGNVFTFVPDVSSAKGAASSIIGLFDREVEIDADSPTGNQLTNVQGFIDFKGVHFRYPTRPSVRVLRGLNLSIKPGQFVALVGPSGCGKSTIIQLVERFYDTISGSVEIDGQNVRDLNVKSLRESISLVSQEPTLYDGSIRFNITLGATREVTQAEIEDACRQANIHEFILSTPDGYDTLVGGKGSQLSGGQKQRIAIARALIRNPKILLLDEATSALDSQSEKVVQAALDQAAKNRTTIAVAHRLSTIQNADVIYVLRDGRVAEKGTHQELLAKHGIYAELVQQQALEKRH